MLQNCLLPAHVRENCFHITKQILALTLFTGIPQDSKIICSSVSLTSALKRFFSPTSNDYVSHVATEDSFDLFKVNSRKFFLQLFCQILCVLKLTSPFWHLHQTISIPSSYSWATMLCSSYYFSCRQNPDVLCCISRWRSLEPYLELLFQKNTNQGIVTLITYFLETTLHSTDNTAISNGREWRKHTGACCKFLSCSYCI